MLPNTERIRKIRISCIPPVKICRQTLQLEMFGKIVGNAAGRRRGPATGINYGAAATDWESMDSEAVSRPDQKDKSIGS